MVGKRVTKLRTGLDFVPLGVFVFGLLTGGLTLSAKPDGEAPVSAPQSERKQQDPLVQLIRALTPEQKAKLMESIKTWQQLGPELKTALRARDHAIRKSLSEEVQAALEGSSFSKEQRETFEKRYKEERKKLESSLRAEFEARRKGALEDLVNSLKKSVAQGDVP